MRKWRIICILIFLVILANSLPNLKKIKTKNEKLDSIPKSNKKKTREKPKEYYNELIEKGLIVDNLTRGNPPPDSYKPINYKKDKIKRKEILKNFTKISNRRKLYETQTLQDLGFIDISENASYAFRFVMNNVKKEESKFILYPYPFNYKEKGNVEEKTVNNGGFFHLNQSQLTGQKFPYIQNITSATIGKAKGIYDIDIGIMSLPYIFKGNEIDLFTEASQYCDYFVSSLNKLSSCLLGKEGYLEYKNKYPNKGAVVRINNEDILNDILFDPQTEQLKIKLLIFSDYLSENEDTIFDKYLKQEQISKIVKFRDLGGHILVSGKSGYLLEKMEFIPENTYDTSFTINTKSTWKDSTNVNPISGCENIYKNSIEEQPDFFKQLICMGYMGNTYLSRTFTLKQVPDTFESLIKYTNKNQFLQMEKDGYETKIEDKDITYDYILVSKEVIGKGRIMIVNGNPIQSNYYLVHTRNFILYAMTKNLIYDLKIKFNSNSDEDLPIPAGEEGVQIVASFKILNLDVTDMTDVEVNILFAEDIKVIEENGISLIVNDPNKYKDLNVSSIDNEKYLKFTSNTITKLNKFEKEFKLEITNYKITQKLIDIPIMYSKITYKENGKEYINTPGIFYAQAEAAALLRGTINKDPTSYWPMNGWGLYFDLVLAIENKENSIAKDVNFISIIPLVSPLMDGNDQNSIAQVIPLYDKYYKNHNYEYPWKSIENRGTDYIDYVEVGGKGVYYVQDFDTPVKIKKIPRDEVKNIKEDIYTPKDGDKIDDYAGETKASNASLLKQVYFADNEQFYETAETRTSLFINTAMEEGAKAMYGNSIPDDIKDPNKENRAKTQYAFVRVDTYFYPSEHEQYQIPNGLDSNILISIDKFEQSEKNENQKLGFIKKKLVHEGHYDSNKESGQTLKPNEWANNLREYSYLEHYDPTKEEDLKKLQNKTTDTIRLSHYLFPCSNKKIERAGSIYGFTENSDGTGFLTEYNSVKFIYGHSINLILDPSITRLGGKAEIYLGETKFNDQDNEVIDNERVTVSADNVAFFKTEYINNNEENKVILYFRRGLMPNENYGQPSKCKVFLENLDKKENITVTIKIYNLKYDFSQDNLESLILVSTLEGQLAEYISFFSFPCLYIENKLKRKPTYSEEYSYDMYEYELMNTYSRYGGYYQELTKHTSVYATSEAHHVTNPGFQTTSPGFTLIGNIGTSPIPFGEFLEHGQLFIPGAISTSRLEWIDIWGRKWGQNLRSVYPDIPPLPPVPLSFIMTTTYELITNDKENKQERVLEWQSDESVYIKIQMKIRNTYKLYWEPTFCFENQKPFIKNYASEYRSPIFLTPEEPEDLTGVSDEHDVNLGFNSTYGVCYKEGSYIEGQRISETISKKMWEMMSCSADANAEQMTACSNKVKGLNLPKLVKKPDNIITNDKEWNYSPLIEEYLPKGYIHSDLMWQLTMENDYWDDSFYKGYPWHLDDCIPNLDNFNTKPHDLIAFPIYKGLGYNITYDSSYSLKNYSKYKGWWSDQLQNSDHTLLAGQDEVNQISVGKQSLIKDSKWINAKKLKYSPKTFNVAEQRLKNIYVCLFNQHRVKVTPYQKKYAFLKNVYQNNVVPVIPDLTEKDPRYNNFDCSGEKSYQYTQYNISKVDNRVYTNNDRDWLYFAAGLRSNARENINVILKLDPIEGTFFEGITKVQDGGRFTYWQPPDGPNSYGYFDSNVNTVISKRVDLSITHRMIPTVFNTFNFYTYQLFNIEDKKEDKREFNMNIYTNSHGYGDATTTIYVGGIDSTKCRVEPNAFTYVKIVFYNNAGFDWIMKENAIEYTDVISEARLNAMSIMMDINTAIKHPTKYNFITPIIPDEIKDYITLTPSRHVSDVSPQFYDLTFNNVLNIKDALEGDYFYCLNITNDFPDKYKGKLWEIPLILNESYFESLPSVNDPTGIHDYHLTIPSIRFGVPIDKGEYKGKIFYNLGQAKELKFTYQIYKSFIFKGIKILTGDDIDKILEAGGDNDRLRDEWENIDGSPILSKKIKVTNYTLDDFYQEITVDLSDAFPKFPYEQEQGPFITNISVLIKTFSGFIPFGYKNHLILTNISYHDFRKQKKAYADYPLYINCYSKGPSIRPDFSTKVVELDEKSSSYIELPSENQTIYEGDRVTIKLTLKATNEGTEVAHYPTFNLGLNPDAVYKPQENNNNNLKYVDNGVNGDIREIRISYEGSISPNEYRKIDLYFEMKFEEAKKNSLRNLDNSNKGSISLVKSLDITLCTKLLENQICDESSTYFGKQVTEKTYKITYMREEEKGETEDNEEKGEKGEKGEEIIEKEEKDDKKEEEENKEEEEKKSPKIYIIVISIIAGLLFILVGGLLFYKFVWTKKKADENEVEDEDISIPKKNTNQIVLTQRSRTKRSIQNKRETEQIIQFKDC